MTGCEVVTRNPRIAVKQNGRTFTLSNMRRRKVVLVTVDGCAITAGERCDYLFKALEKELFVELKGADIKKAVSQIYSSIEKISQAVERGKRAAAIVSSRVPREDTSTMVAKRRLLQSVTKLYVRNGSFELTLESAF